MSRKILSQLIFSVCCSPYITSFSPNLDEKDVSLRVKECSARQSQCSLKDAVEEHTNAQQKRQLAKLASA